MNKILITLVIIAAIVAAVVFTAVNKLDGYIADIIETEGTSALGTNVKVNGVKTDLVDGTAVITGVSVANRSGYQSANALQITQVFANVDYQSQIVEQIVIDQPTVNAELIGLKSNFEDLLDNMPETSETDESEEIELTIRNFQLNRAQVNVLSDKLGQQSFTMENFEMNNLRGTPSEISEELTTALTNHITRQVKSYASTAIGELAKEEIKKRATEKINEVVGEKLEGKLDEELGDKLKKFGFGKD